MGLIKELPIEPTYHYLNTCQKCGCHISKRISLTFHKRGGQGIGFASIEVCGNCRNGTNFIF